MKTVLLLLSLSTLCLGAPLNTPEKLPFDDTYLFGLLHHLCYWHLDDYSYFKYDTNDTVEILYKELSPPGDPGDKSVYCEIIVPGLDMSVMMKKALYRIEEMDTTISNTSYKFTSFNREINLAANPKYKAYCKKLIPEKELFELIFNKRASLPELTPYLIHKLKEALPKIVAGELPNNKDLNEIFYIAPVTKYENTIIIFWENEKKLIVLSSDADFSTPLFWQSLSMSIEIFDMKKDIVTSLQQVLGSNAYVTKNWISRILFNCVIDGYKLNISVPAQKKPASPITDNR